MQEKARYGLVSAGETGEKHVDLEPSHVIPNNHWMND
jgi:hypothetical protein